MNTQRSMPHTKRYLQPYLRLFPIWRYGAIYSRLEGLYVRDGWYPDRFGTREITREQALALR